MTHEQRIREQRQALNAAINNQDVDKAKSFLHPDYAGKMFRTGSIDRKAMVKQMEHMLKSVKDFKSQVDVETVEVENDSAKLLVSRTEVGRMDNSPWALLGVAALCLGLAVFNIVRGHHVDVPVFADGAVVAEQGDRVDLGRVVAKGDFDLAIERVQSHLLNAVIYAVGYLFCIGLAFFTGRRSFHTTIKAQETWRNVDGHWLVAEEEQLDTGTPLQGPEYKSKVMLLGLPLVHVAFGRGADNRRRVAKGWIAAGDMACGVLFAAGGIAVGGIAVGGLSLGIVSLAGLAVGVFAFGGAAVAVWAFGGVALGVFAIGGAAIAWTAAEGGLAIAHDYAVGGGAYAAHANDIVANNFVANGTFFSAFEAARPYIRHLPWLFVLCVPLLLLLPFWASRRAGQHNSAEPN